MSKFTPPSSKQNLDSILKKVYQDLNRVSSVVYGEGRSKTAERLSDMRVIEDKRLQEYALEVRYKDGWKRFVSVDGMEKRISEIRKDAEQSNLDLVNQNRLLREQLLAALKEAQLQTVEGASDYVFTTTAKLSGVVDRIFVKNRNQVEGNPLITGTWVRVFNVASGNSQSFRVSADKAGTDNVIMVEPVVMKETYPAGAYVYVSDEEIRSGLYLSQNVNKLFNESRAIGIITDNVSGLVSTIPVYLYDFVRAGEEITVINEITQVRYDLTIAEDKTGGWFDLAIVPEEVDLHVGALINYPGVMFGSYIHSDPGKLQAGIDATRKGNQIAAMRLELQAGSSYTQIPVKDCKTMTLADNMEIEIRTWGGISTIFTVNGKQDITPSTQWITVDSKFLVIDLAPDDSIFEPNYSSTSRIELALGQVVLKAQVSAGTITSLARVELRADVTSGSSIKLGADNLDIEAQTTFLSALYAKLRDEGFQDVSGLNVTLYADNAPSNRGATWDNADLVQGDRWIKTNDRNLPHVYDGTTPYNVNGWKREYSSVNGGEITTGILRADLVKIQNAAGSVPQAWMNTDGYNLDLVVSTNDTAESAIGRSLHWINQSYLVGGVPETKYNIRQIAYAGTAFDSVGMDVIGSNNSVALRWSLYRSIGLSPNDRDFDIGIAGKSNDFVSGSAQGDVIISTRRNIFLRHRTATAERVVTFPTGVSGEVIMTNGSPTIYGVKTIDATGYLFYQRADDSSTASVLNRSAGDNRWARKTGANEFTADNKFQYQKLMVGNSTNAFWATLRHGQASNNTYTFIGDSSNVLTDARGIRYESVGSAVITEDSTIYIILPNGNRYSFRAQFEP